MCRLPQQCVGATVNKNKKRHSRLACPRLPPLPDPTSSVADTTPPKAGHRFNPCISSSIVVAASSEALPFSFITSVVVESTSNWKHSLSSWYNVVLTHDASFVSSDFATARCSSTDSRPGRKLDQHNWHSSPTERCRRIPCGSLTRTGATLIVLFRPRRLLRRLDILHPRPFTIEVARAPRQCRRSVATPTQSARRQVATHRPDHRRPSETKRRTMDLTATPSLARPGSTCGHCHKHLLRRKVATAPIQA